MSSDAPTMHPVTWIADAISGAAIVGTIVGYLPVIAAVAGLCWYLIQIFESRTVQHWLSNRQMIRKARRIARLKAKEKVIVAQLEALESIRQAKVEARDKVETAKVEAEKLRIHEENQATTQD